MISLVRKGKSMRSVASQFGVSLHTVQRWVAHSAGQRLDRVDWSGARGGRRETQATSSEVEGLVIGLRTQLRDHSDLNKKRTAANQHKLSERRVLLGLDRVPSVRTIGRILERRGALDGRR